MTILQDRAVEIITVGVPATLEALALISIERMRKILMAILQELTGVSDVESVKVLGTIKTNGPIF